MPPDPEPTESIDRVFAALAHPIRRRVLDLLMLAPGASVAAIASHFDCSRIAVMKHLRKLQDADLLISEKVGRTRHLYFNPIPIQQIHDRWTTKYSVFWSQRIVDLQTRVEERANARRKKHA